MAGPISGQLDWLLNGDGRLRDDDAGRTGGARPDPGAAIVPRPDAAVTESGRQGGEQGGHQQGDRYEGDYDWRSGDRIVPAYALTQGRTRTVGPELPLEALVTATELAG